MYGSSYGGLGGVGLGGAAGGYPGSRASLWFLIGMTVLTTARSLAHTGIHRAGFCRIGILTFSAQ
jgi:hypothetical protein